MTIKDSFLEEVKIGRIVEVVIGPKAIKGEIVLIGQDMIIIKKNDGGTANVVLDGISYFEFDDINGHDEIAIETDRDDGKEKDEVTSNIEQKEADSGTPKTKEIMEEKKSDHDRKKDGEVDNNSTSSEVASKESKSFEFFPVEEEFGRIFGIDSDEYIASVKAFDNFKYQETLDILDQYISNNKEKEKDAEGLREYLAGVLSRFNSENDLSMDETNLYKGIVISKVERNPDKAAPYLLKAVDEGGKRLKTAIYRSLIIYQVSGEMEKASNMALKLMNATKSVTPEFDQVILWKTMLMIFRETEDTDSYSEALNNLIECSVNHPVSCVNSILKFIGWLEDRKDEEYILSIYNKALTLNAEGISVLMHMVSYLLKREPDSDIDSIISPYLTNKELKDVWNTMQPVDIERLRKGDIDSVVRDKTERITISLEDKGSEIINSEKNDNTEIRESDIGKHDKYDKYEKAVHDYLEEKNPKALKKYVKRLQKENKDDLKVKQLIARADIYYTHYYRWNGQKKNNDSEYIRATGIWIDDRDIKEAEATFLADAQSDSETKKISMLTYADMLAVEYGFEQAYELLGEIENHIINYDREAKVALYEKRYSTAIESDNVDGALMALNTLNAFYYNKTKLGSTAFRQAECYSLKEKWEESKEHYEKAIEYGYNVGLCEQRILLCRANMGELVEANITEENTQIYTENISQIKKKIQSLYDDIKYAEAYEYVKKIGSERPDDEEVQALIEETRVVLTRYQKLKNSYSKTINDHGRAIRAWRIEDDVKKAEKYFKKGIKSAKKGSCIQDYARMIMTVKGDDEAVAVLLGFESKVPKMSNSSQAAYYESLYFLSKKIGDVDKMLYSADKLLNVYQKSNKENAIRDVYIKMMTTLFHTKQYEKAIDICKKALDSGIKSKDFHRCIILSYSYLGDKYKAETYLDDMEKTGGLKASDIIELRSNVLAVFERQEKGDAADDEEVGIENDIFDSESIFGYKAKFREFILNKYQNHPVVDAREDIINDSVSDELIHKLDNIGKDVSRSDGTKYLGTAAYLEKKLNDETEYFNELMSNTVKRLGGDYSIAGKRESALACFCYELEEIDKSNYEESNNEDLLYTMKFLSCIAKDHTIYQISTVEKAYDDITGYINSIMGDESDSEDSLSALALLMEKSSSLKKYLTSTERTEKDIWVSQMSNYIDESSECNSINELLALIRNRYKQEKNQINIFSNKIRASRVYNTQLLSELRNFRKLLSVRNEDKTYLSDLLNVYERGIDIFEYSDYENRIAHVNNTIKGLEELLAAIQSTPTYFTVNYLQDIITNLMDIAKATARKTNEELGPDITVSLPITEIPIVDGKQSIPVTVSDRENMASAREIYLRIHDVNDKELIESFSIAPYIRGGQSVSREIEIPSQGEEYTIHIVVDYLDHEDNRRKQSYSFSISAGKEEFEPIDNPYYTGEAIDVSRKQVFFGRDLLLDSIENAISEGMSRCEIIYGQKRCGKSSIANFLEDRFKDKFLVVKFSLGSAVSIKNVYTNCRDCIVLRAEDLMDDNDLITDELIDELDRRSIETDEEFVSFMRFVYRKICKPLNKDIVLMIDEFTHLYRYINEDRRRVTDFMDTWKKLIEAKLFRAVIIGQDTMPNFFNEFKNQFQVVKPIRVDRLDDDSVRKLISDPIRLPNGESRFMENSVDLIASWFYGQPYYIQTYCNKLVEQMNADRKVRVTNALAEKVKRIMLHEKEEDFFDNLISKGDEYGTEKECYDVLKLIAKLTKNSVYASIEEIDIDNKEEILSDLSTRKVIEIVEGNKCRILISFFKDWLNLN